MELRPESGPPWHTSAAWQPKGNRDARFTRWNTEVSFHGRGKRRESFVATRHGSSNTVSRTVSLDQRVVTKFTSDQIVEIRLSKDRRDCRNRTSPLRFVARFKSGVRIDTRGTLIRGKLQRIATKFAEFQSGGGASVGEIRRREEIASQRELPVQEFPSVAARGETRGEFGNKGSNDGPGDGRMHSCDECIRAARPVRRTKASRASDYGGSAARRQNTSDPSIPRETSRERTA